MLEKVIRRFTRSRTEAPAEFPDSAGEALPSMDRLRSLMARYRTDRLVGISPERFKERIDRFLALEDWESEGYAGPDRQRDLSVKFHWGHDHDFGDFRLRGRMGERHIWLMAVYRDLFRSIPRSFEGRSVLDIGCWTGGTALLLRAMGAKVHAIEEVRKYADCVRFLQECFAVEGLRVEHASLFELDRADVYDRFDIVHYAGVVYHVTDPVLSLRIVYNCLNDGGLCLVETYCDPDPRGVLRFEGPSVIAFGEERLRNRGGWNWFVPSPSALRSMMAAVGFEEIELRRLGNRAFAVGRRRGHVDMLRAGLSVPDVR